MVTKPTGKFQKARNAVEQRLAAADHLAADRLQELDEQIKLTLAITESLGEGVCILDANGRIVFLNAAASRILGWTREDLLGEALPEPILQTDENGRFYPADAHPLHQVIHAGVTIHDQEALFVRKDGATVPVAYTASPINSGVPADSAVVVFRDISRRKAAEQKERQVTEALRRSQERLQAIVSGAANGIVLLDLSGQILQTNLAFEHMLNGAAEDLVGANFADFIVPEDRPLHQRYYAELAAGTRSSYALELRCQGWQTMAPLWVELTVSLLRNRSGEPQHALVLLQNITERKTAARELRELQRRLARSRENERQRLAQELHDGPLQDLYAARYQLQALQRALDPEQSRQLDGFARKLGQLQVNFQQVNDALRAICNDLRPPSLGPFGLEAAIRSHAERFQQMYPHLTVNLDLMPDGQTLPEYLRLTLYRVYQEMLSNVARHAAANNVLVRFTFDEDELLLEIQDDGIGFDVPERWIELAREGHLGLVGAAERAEEINGRLTILSAPTQGTIVRVAAPRQNAA